MDLEPTRHDHRNAPFAIVAGCEFASAAALKRRLQSILHSYDTGDYLTVADCHFMLAALRRHHDAADKIRLGVWQFQKRLNWSEGRKKAPGFWLLRVDGTEDVFSIHDLVKTEETDKDRFLDWLTEAMRAAIAGVVAEVRDEAFAGRATIRCPITNRQITASEAHVDHSGAWPLIRIRDEFLREYGRWLRLAHVDHEGLGCRFTDPDLRAEFIAFHNHRAILQVIWSKANMAKNSGGYRSDFDSETLILKDVGEHGP